MFSRILYARSILSPRIFTSLPGSRLGFFIAIKFSIPTINSTPSYSSIDELYAQNPVFEIAHKESVKVYLHMYNGNVQQNLLCVESCVTKEFSISPQFSPTIFDPDANLVLLRSHSLVHWPLCYFCTQATRRNMLSKVGVEVEVEDTLLENLKSLRLTLAHDVARERSLSLSITHVSYYCRLQRTTAIMKYYLLFTWWWMMSGLQVPCTLYLFPRTFVNSEAIAS